MQDPAVKEIRKKLDKLNDQEDEGEKETLIRAERDFRRTQELSQCCLSAS